MAPGNLPGALVYPSPRSPRFPTASSAVFQGPPIDFLFQPLKTLSGALEAPQRPTGKTRPSKRAPIYTKSRIGPTGRPGAGSTRPGRPTGPGRRGGPPHDRRTAEARRNRTGPSQEHHPGRAGQDAAQPRRPATGPAGAPAETGGPATRPKGGRNPEGAEGAPPHRTGSRRARPYAAQRAAFDRQGPAESPGGAFGEGAPAREDGTPDGPAGSEATEDEKGPANRPGPPSGADRPPRRAPPKSASIKARPTGRGYRLVAEGGTAGGLLARAGRGAAGGEGQRRPQRAT